MHIKSKGFSLLELAITMSILLVVGVGVTNLSVKVIESQRDEANVLKQIDIYATIQDDLRKDLSSATAVWIGNGTVPGPGSNKSYYSISNAVPGNVTGDTLDILQEVSYNETTNITTVNYVRYRFVTYSATEHALVRMQKNGINLATDPGHIWPKYLARDEAAGVACAGAPLYVDFNSTEAWGLATPASEAAAMSDDDTRLYNLTGTSARDVDIVSTAANAFVGVYGEGYDAPPDTLAACWDGNDPTTNKIYYISTVTLDGLRLSTRNDGADSVYDEVFGTPGVQSPSMTFEVNPSIKFF